MTKRQSQKIGYKVPGTGYGVVTLKMYDILFWEVATLVNERKNGGSYEVKFDASGLAGGVYLYRLQVRPVDSATGRDSRSGAGNFIATKKFQLLR